MNVIPESTDTPAETLVARCLARDSHAWTELVLALDPVIVRCLVRRLGTQHHHAFEDLRMDVLEALVARDMLILRVFRSRPFDDLRAYVHRVARNRTARYLERRKAGQDAEAACAFVSGAEEAGASDLDEVIDGKRALDRLEGVGGGQGGLIARLRAGGHSLPEISQRAGVSPATVKRTLRAWRTALDRGPEVRSQGPRASN